MLYLFVCLYGPILFVINVLHKEIMRIWKDKLHCWVYCLFKNLVLHITFNSEIKYLKLQWTKIGCIYIFLHIDHRIFLSLHINRDSCFRTKIKKQMQVCTGLQSLQLSCNRLFLFPARGTQTITGSHPAPAQIIAGGEEPGAGGGQTGSTVQGGQRERPDEDAVLTVSLLRRGPDLVLFGLCGSQSQRVQMQFTPC